MATFQEDPADRLRKKERFSAAENLSKFKDTLSPIEI